MACRISLGLSSLCLYQLARAMKLMPAGSAPDRGEPSLLLSPPAVDVLSGWLSHTSTTLFLLGALAISLHAQPERSRSFFIAGGLLGLTALDSPGSMRSRSASPAQVSSPR